MLNKLSEATSKYHYGNKYLLNNLMEKGYIGLMYHKCLI